MKVQNKIGKRTEDLLVVNYCIWLLTYRNQEMMPDLRSQWQVIKILLRFIQEEFVYINGTYVT